MKIALIYTPNSRVRMGERVLEIIKKEYHETIDASTFDLKGIGYLKSSKIAYRNLTNYLSPSSDFNDARKGSIQSAIDLYGFGSQEYIATTDAWYAVGVGKKYTAIPTPDFYIEKLVCDLNTDMQFVNTSGTATS